MPSAYPALICALDLRHPRLSPTSLKSNHAVRSAPQTVSLRSTDAQYAVRRPAQSFHTQYEYAVRSTQAVVNTAHSKIRNTGAEYAGRPQAVLGRARQDAIRNTQYAEHPQAALSTACQDVIRSTQYADTPTALTYLLLSLTNCILIRSWGPGYAVVQYVAYTVVARSLDEPQERSGVGRRLPHREGDMPYYR